MEFKLMVGGLARSAWKAWGEISTKMHCAKDEDELLSLKLGWQRSRLCTDVQE